MGFWGSFVLCKTDIAFEELAIVEAWDLEVVWSESCGNGWVVGQVEGMTVLENAEEILASLATDTGSPALTGYVMDSDAVAIEASTPVRSLSLCLPRLYALLEAPEGVELTETAETAVPKLLTWARAARSEPDEEALRSLIDSEEESTESYEGHTAFFALLSGLGFEVSEENAD